MKKRWIWCLIFIFAFSLMTACAKKEEAKEGKKEEPKATEQKKDVTLATTTSTQDTGLLDVLIPEFTKKTGYKVKTVAVGSGEALKMGQEGNADVLLTHAPKNEQELVDNKDIINYQLVMHNDFVIVGPDKDPAGIKGMKSAAEAFKKIADTKSTFISRGDNSGTNKKEKSIWEIDGITPKGNWYVESGTGMGETLGMAAEKDAYTLSDRATYLTQKEKVDLVILVEGDRALLNIYHVAQVNPDKHKNVNAEGAKAFVKFMVAPETQKMIGNFGKDKFNQSLFIPDAGKKEEDL